MKKGIFRRLLLTYILILLAIIAFFSMSLAQFFKVYFFEEKQKDLINIGRQVETYLIMYHRGDITKEELSRQVDTVGHAVNARVIVIESSKAQLTNEGIGTEFGDLLKQVIEGNVVVKRQQYDEEMDTYVVAVGLPVQIAQGRQGAVLLFSPVYEVASALGYVYRIIGLAASVSFVVGLILVWNYSRMISRPIINLSRMAGKIAEGERVEDITDEAGGEVGQLVKSFNIMKNQLARTEKMRQEFIAGVSHELRTPLTSVRGFIQGILDGIVGREEQNRYLKLAFQETERLTRLTNDLLELTKLEAGAVELKKQKVCLKDLVEDSVLSARKGEGAKEVPVQIQVNPSDLTLTGDPDRLKQVFINLLSNAMKYTPPDGYIKVEAMMEEEHIKITFSDTGIGIPTDDLSLIFEKFHRVDKSRSATVGGTGLGLSIVRNLVELHGGKITVKSNWGSGTTFTIFLPANQ